MTAARLCSHCQTQLDKDVAHCPSPTCTWCRACVARKTEETKP